MFCSRVSFKVSNLSKVTVKLAGQIQSHQKSKIPKVTDKTVWINVIDQEGNKRVIPGYEGESMMYALQKNNVPIPCSCRGGDLHAPETENPPDNMRYGAVCSECQVVVFEPWVNYLKDIGKTEYNQLVRAIGFVSPHSRLSCCIALEKWMNGIELAIPYVPIVHHKKALDVPWPVGSNRIF
ncbi:unnamed protein product [Blepharisma stoltei]|uniref:2Fe-2S ferredoxin-type domain-containing protein n=1 Tax=Blepharisma stoltei TaxID=1481888 RepID=A0AAU9JYX9_9CILI|nr:unnamed protein product [Blepharisma stoltei]